MPGGLDPAIFGLPDVRSTGRCPDRDYFCSVFMANVSVLLPIGQQRNGEWAVLVIFLEDARRNGFGGPPTLKRGDLAIARDAWLEQVKAEEN